MKNLPEKKELIFKPEELLQAGMLNYQVFMLLTMKFIQEHQLALKDLALYFGKEMAKGWEKVMHATPEQIAREFAKNYLTAGATKAYYQETEDGFEIEIIGWPNKQLVKLLALPENFTKDWNFVFEPIATAYNFSYTFEQTEEMLLIKITK
ncbi:MAG: hypothetical protein DRP02_05095 [Candidatus Gerdarchaeota archaeon]|nr:MAG: hypothetical protein DRP02_05095 [Candidatus Gerdarchaeota archaeon]